MFIRICCALALVLTSHYAFTQKVKLPAVIPDLIKYTALPPIKSFKEIGVLPDIKEQFVTATTDCACITGTCTVLPVTILSFDAKRKDINEVDLYWKTTNEINNKGFNVQRSLGNSEQFETIAFVPALMNSAIEKKYSLRDQNNFEGISYYRLQQIDEDGKFAYSEIRAVKGYSGSSSLSLYPNPVRERLVADIYSPQITRAHLMIFDGTQKLLHSQMIAVNKGINLVNLPVRQLPAGMYFIKITSGDNSILSGKFMKL